MKKHEHEGATERKKRVLPGGFVAEQEHSHTHKHTKAILNRMARLIGHMQAVRRMVEEGRDCSEVIVQLSAVDSAIKAVSKVILEEHLDTCIVDALRTGDEAEIEALKVAVRRFMK